MQLEGNTAHVLPTCFLRGSLEKFQLPPWLSHNSLVLKFLKTQRSTRIVPDLAHYCIINLLSPNLFSFIFSFTFGHLIFISNLKGLWKLLKVWRLLLLSKTAFFSISRTVDFITSFGNAFSHLISSCLTLSPHPSGCILSTVLSEWEKKKKSMIYTSVSETLYWNNPGYLLKSRFSGHWHQRDRWEESWVGSKNL